jgi:glucuronide carrier protein
MSTIQEIRREFVEEKLAVRSVLGYGLGDFANNLAFTLSTAFLLYYYTDVAGLSAAAVATLFFVVRLWDAFADIFAGRLVDRTMTRWGKFRPFILFGAVPLLFLSYLTFHVPSGLTDSSKLLYAYLTYGVLGLVYSLVNIPYGSLASAMTQSVNERAKLVSSRFFGGAVGGLLLTFVIAPKISSLKADKKNLSPTEYADRAQSIFTTTTLSFIVIGSLAYLVVFFTTREKVVRTEARVSIRDTWAAVRSNKPLGYLCAASFFYLIGLFAVGGASAYYAAYVLGDIKYLVHVTVVNSGASILLAPFIPRLVDRFGKTKLFQWCGLLTIAGGLGIFFVPTGALAPALLFLAIKGFGAALINTLMFGLEADTVEYGEWKSGKRSEGATYALFSFTRKITQSIGGALGAAALAFGGYISATKAVPNPVQPESAIFAIRVVMGLLPMVAALAAMAIFSRYPLTDERFRQIRDETELRKQQQGHLIAPDGHDIACPRPIAAGPPPGPGGGPSCTPSEAEPLQLLGVALPVLGDLDVQVEVDLLAEQRLDPLARPRPDVPQA